MSTWQIQRDINNLTNGLHTITRNIHKYKNTRTHLQHIRQNHQTNLRTLDFSYNQIRRRGLSPVKQIGAFEGEMANTLTSLVTNGLADIEHAMNATKAVSRAIDNQINKLNVKITNLEREVTMQNLQIQNRRRDLAMANRRRR